MATLAALPLSSAFRPSTFERPIETHAHPEHGQAWGQCVQHMLPMGATSNKLEARRTSSCHVKQGRPCRRMLLEKPIAALFLYDFNDPSYPLLPFSCSCALRCHSKERTRASHTHMHTHTHTRTMHTPARTHNAHQIKVC